MKFHDGKFYSQIIQFFVGQEDLKKLCEIGLMIIVILGRWMLPRGSITRDQLSVLLLEYVAIAANILELFEAFEDEQVILYCGLVTCGAKVLLNKLVLVSLNSSNFLHFLN